MIKQFCKACKKILFEANAADVLIKCKGCGRMNHVQFYSAKFLSLTTEEKSDTIKLIKQKK